MVALISISVVVFIWQVRAWRWREVKCWLLLSTTSQDICRKNTYIRNDSPSKYYFNHCTLRKLRLREGIYPAKCRSAKTCGRGGTWIQPTWTYSRPLRSVTLFPTKASFRPAPSGSVIAGSIAGLQPLSSPFPRTRHRAAAPKSFLGHFNQPWHINQLKLISWWFYISLHVGDSCSSCCEWENVHGTMFSDQTAGPRVWEPGSYNGVLWRRQGSCGIAMWHLRVHLDP